MRKIGLLILSMVFLTSATFGQDAATKEGHTNQGKFLGLDIVDQIITQL